LVEWKMLNFRRHRLLPEERLNRFYGWLPLTSISCEHPSNATLPRVACEIMTRASVCSDDLSVG
jgi:hypothetical protein